MKLQCTDKKDGSVSTIGHDEYDATCKRIAGHLERTVEDINEAFRLGHGIETAFAIYERAEDSSGPISATNRRTHS